MTENLELGQMLFSGQTFLDVDGDRFPYVGDGISTLDHFLAEALGEDFGRTGNEGVNEFTSSVFDMRGYCWCDGVEHPDGCPLNFVHHASGFGVSWYKHLGRGVLISRAISAREWARILIQCLNHVGLEVKPSG